MMLRYLSSMLVDIVTATPPDLKDCIKSYKADSRINSYKGHMKVFIFCGKINIQDQTSAHTGAVAADRKLSECMQFEKT